MQKILDIISSRKRLIGFIIIVIVILVIGRQFFFRPSETTEEVEPVDVEKDVITASGKVQAKNSVILRFPTASKVVWVGVEKGDYVQAWQGLVSLDQQLLRKNLDKKLLDYMTTRWNFEQQSDDYNVRGKPLHEVIWTDEQKRVFEKAQFALDKSVIDVEMQDLTIKESVLVTPISGTVVAVEGFEEGINLAPATLSTSYVKIVDLSSVYFEAEVDELDYAYLSAGQTAQVMIDAYPEVILNGTVEYIGKEGLETTGGGLDILVDIKLEQHDLDLIEGLNGEVELLI